MRYLVLLLLAVVAVWLLRRALRGPGAGPTASGGAGADDLVSCAHCGVHLPRAEASLSGDRVYCTAEHARLGPRQG